MTTTSSLGANIKKLRKAKGLSHAALAEKANISQSAISQIENGVIKGTKHLVPLAAALGVSVEELTKNDSNYSISNWQSEQNKTLEVREPVRYYGKEEIVDAIKLLEALKPIDLKIAVAMLRGFAIGR